MKIDLDESGELRDYISVPAGSYVCRITEIRAGATRAGDERWSMKLVVAEGQHVGKQAAWDSLVFSARGRGRARLVLHALGLPCSGTVELQPSDLEGRHALVEIRPAEYQTPAGGVVRRNEVPYDGYRPVEMEPATAVAAPPQAAPPPPRAPRRQPLPGPVDVNELPF